MLPGFPIDINTATAEDLALLPGIGPKTAARILEKRKELGGFTSVDQLTEVKWVGKVKLEKIRNLVTIKGPVGRPARKVLPKQ
ncbi:MAG: helix-hairpin-helix domain-containing protein [Deltaproteobacteria bacterium]|nr:helix-hairpin-helix domain-containing protein [Deltaproteobacteria bacterium]